MIICINGLPGSGKTELASSMVSEFQKRGMKVKHFTTDFVRRRLFFEASIQDSDFELRDFTNDELLRSYNGIYMLIEQILIADPSTIIVTDGTYRESKQRLLLENIANRVEGCDFYLIKIETSEDTRQKRVQARVAAGGHGGTFDGVYEPIKAPYTIVTNDHDLNQLHSDAKQLVEAYIP